MQIRKSYNNTKFSSEAISNAKQAFEINSPSGVITSQTFRCGKQNSQWDYDTYEQFLSAYPSASTYGLTLYGESRNHITIEGEIGEYTNVCVVWVRLPSEKQIENIFQVFDNDKDKITIPDKEKEKAITKSFTYLNIKFSASVIIDAYNKFIDIIDKESPEYQSYSLSTNNEEWELPNIDEFIAGYEKSDESSLTVRKDLSTLRIYNNINWTRIAISHIQRDKINSLFNIFDSNKNSNIIINRTPKRFTVFIGHGGNSQWKELKDHLSEKHQFNIDAYEIGATAGYTIKEILSSKLDNASMALLVCTGENKDNQDLPHARENVIHELGLFQGRLGFSKAIILLEHEVQEFSNIHGIQQLRFSKGNIKEVFGDVIAAINREKSLQSLTI